MAQQRNQADELKFSCPICLDLLKDPVTIPCGHNYCMGCIKAHWDGQDQGRMYSCPQCRQTFSQRPVLCKNTMLAELVEDRKKTEVQAASDLCYAGPEDVSCDVCSGRRLKALKSCLVCQASYCEQHLQPHYQSPTFKKHKLVQPSIKLQENMCSHHDEVMKIFCRTDQKSICYLCLMDEHKGHHTVSAAAERTERQKELDVSRQNIQQRIQDREEDVKVLQQEVEAVNQSADKAVEDSEKTFTELIHLIQKRSSEVKQKIRLQQESEVSRAKDLQEKMDQEISALKRRGAELELLSHTEDHIQFLHRYGSVTELPAPTNPPRPKDNRLQYFEDVKTAVTAARDKIQNILTEQWMKSSLTKEDTNVLLTQTEPQTRAEFLEYSRQIILEPNTAHNVLVLSDGNRKITFNDKNPAYPHHPDRFTGASQVLSKDGLTGRCYWEVELIRSRFVRVGVAYKSIARSGDSKSFVFGCNKKSWVLDCGGSYTFMHDNQFLDVPGPKSSRVGVYLDHSAGVLCFYSFSDTMTLLHRVQTRFTEPLYAGLFLWGSDGDTAKFCELK